jgi:hypothetical protein
LTRAGIPVHRTAWIVAAASLSLSLEFVWAPMVDASLSRRAWFVGGAAVMCASLAALLMVPWTIDSLTLLAGLAYTSCFGMAVAGVAIKGLMACEMPAAQLSASSAFYTAGGIFAKTVGGAGTLWLVSHLSSRGLAAGLSAGTAALAGTAIQWISPTPWLPLKGLPAKLRSALLDVWRFIRTRQGALIAVLCVVPFGSGSEVGLVGAIAREWSIGPDRLAAWVSFSAVGSIAGALFSGWLATRIGPWKAYIAQGWVMIAAMLGLALAPREPLPFFVLELIYRAFSNGCIAAALGIVMVAIGKGAASTKAAILWSLFNFAGFYPTLLEGIVHDRIGTGAMLLTDAALGAAGFAVLVGAARLLAIRPAPNRTE